MLSLFPWRRSFLQKQVSFKMFLKFVLIDDRSVMPTNVLLRKAYWSASSVRWLSFASFPNLRGSLLFLGMKIVLPHITRRHKTHESIELSNEMRKKCVTEIMRGWFLFRCKLHSKKHTLFQVSFQRRRYLTNPCWQVNVLVWMGRLNGVIDT